MNNLSFEEAFRNAWKAFATNVGLWMVLAIPSVLSAAVEHLDVYKGLVGRQKIAAGIVLFVVSFLTYPIATIASLRDVGALADRGNDGSRYFHVAWASIVFMLPVLMIFATIYFPLSVYASLQSAIPPKLIFLITAVLVFIEVIAMLVFYVVFWPYNFVAALDQSSIGRVAGTSKQLTQGRRGLIVAFWVLYLILRVPAHFTFGVSELLVFPLMSLAGAALFKQMRPTSA